MLKLNRSLYILSVSVIFAASFIFSSHASDGPSYTDYCEIEAHYNSFRCVTAQTTDGTIRDYLVAPFRNMIVSCEYEPKSGWKTNAIENTKASQGAAEETANEEPLFSNAVHTVYERTNADGNLELVLKTKKAEKSLVLLSPNIMDSDDAEDGEECPVHLHLNGIDIIYFIDQAEQVGFFNFSRLTEGDPSLHYIYTTAEIQKDAYFDITNVCGCNSTLYFLKTYTGSWPQLWGVDVNTAPCVPKRVETHFPFYITNFKLFPTGQPGGVTTWVNYRHNFRNYTAAGAGVFKNFNRHEDSNASNATPGHYGVFRTDKEGLFHKVYFYPLNGSPEETRLLFDEADHLKMVFPLAEKIVQPITQFVPNSQDKDVRIPVHIYNWDKKDQAPLVLFWLHGGPDTYTDAEFIARQQYFLNQLNCMLVDINYRGSTGYTEALASLAGKIETGAMSDVVSVWDYVKKESPQAKFALYGESWGGFLVSLLLTSKHSEKFLGGVSFSGFYNIKKDFETNKEQLGESLATRHYKSLFGFIPSPSSTPTKKLSITSRIKNLKMPLYVIHGKEDETCPVIQTSLLRDADGSKEKIAQGLLDIKIFDNSDHNFSKDAAAANAAFKGIVDFYRKIEQSHNLRKEKS